MRLAPAEPRHHPIFMRFGAFEPLTMPRLMTTQTGRHTEDRANANLFLLPSHSPEDCTRLDSRQARPGRLVAAIQFHGPDKPDVGLGGTGREDAVAVRLIILQAIVVHDGLHYSALVHLVHQQPLPRHTPLRLQA